MDITHAKRIIIKIGSALLINQQGLIRTEWISSICQDIAHLRTQNIDVVIVSSGSVALGKDALNVGDRALRLEEKQAAAACGQLTLIHTYQNELKKHELQAAQLLLTLEDSENRRRYLNARTTTTTLLNAGIIPIINENDTVATGEIRFGDNDRLAARVAQMIEADYLILLSDINGLYDKNPHTNTHATHMPYIADITDDIKTMAEGVASKTGSGGMKTKLVAAQIAASAGCQTIIGLGTQNHPIQALLNGAKHTLFAAKDSPHNAKKQWIQHSLQPLGELFIDDGALHALKKGNSLLPAGITKVTGLFNRGDMVIIRTQNNTEVARGLVTYGHHDAQQITGKRTSEIEAILHYTQRAAMIHRSDLVMTDTEHPHDL